MYDRGLSRMVLDTVPGFEGLNVAANSSHCDIEGVFIILRIERNVHFAMWNTNVGQACVVINENGMGRATWTEIVMKPETSKGQ